MIEILLGVLVLVGAWAVLLGLGYVFCKMDSFPSTRTPTLGECFEGGIWALVCITLFVGTLALLGTMAYAIGNGILH